MYLLYYSTLSNCNWNTMTISYAPQTPTPSPTNNPEERRNTDGRIQQQHKKPAQNITPNKSNRIESEPVQPINQTWYPARITHHRRAFIKHKHRFVNHPTSSIGSRFNPNLPSEKDRVWHDMREGAQRAPRHQSSPLSSSAALLFAKNDPLF